MTPSVARSGVTNQLPAKGIASVYLFLCKASCVRVRFMMNTLKKSRRLHLPLLATLLVINATGCAKPSSYKAPVGKFPDASTAVIQSTKVDLTELNKVERDQYNYSQP